MVTQPLSILFVTAEASPFAKVGGLADVAAGLPKALARRGNDVRLVLPCYSIVNNAVQSLKDTHQLLHVFQGGNDYIARLWESSLPGGVPVYLLENEELFDRARVYGEKDDLDRFLFLSKAALELPRAIGWRPQLFHCNDWHTGFLPAILHNSRETGGHRAPAACLLTIHNMAYQGWFDQEWAIRAGVASYIQHFQQPPQPQLWSALALGIYYSDAITTVSETYAREILTPELSQGLSQLLRQRQEVLLGIVNGLDYDQFDPSTDPYIHQRYDINSLDKKRANKLALQRYVALTEDASLHVIGNVGRLAEMKGINIMLEAVERLLEDGQRLQFILLGTGEATLEEKAKNLAKRYPKSVGVVIGFDLVLAQLIYSGSDVFLMPSLFEPCGLGQLIAMRYGTIPVARRTGGLADTVKDGVTGFLFDGFRAEEAACALRHALETWQDSSEWRRLMINAMSQDFSWDASAARYEEFYRLAVAVHEKGRCRKTP